ncbi:MAG: hypothetical protein QG654_82 [Patescibacteria group bacterium]|nr:hypothetical protein [Patescibacteria group bacterium]
MRFGVIFLSFFLVPFALMAEGTSTRTGFVDGPVWFSEESLKLDQTVKIYTAIFNGEDSKMTLKVDFIDDTTSLSVKEVFINPNETKTVSADWKISAGDHNIFAVISNTKVGDEQVVLERNKTSSVKFSVTKDIPGAVAKKALVDKFSNIFEGEEGFMDKADSWFKVNFTKSEEFRESKLKQIESSKDKVEKRRKEEAKEKETKASVKVISFIHLYALIIVGFIFSVSVVFYVCAFILSYIALRTIWRILKRIFRKQHEE